MKIKVYVDWRNEEILSEKDYKEFKERKVKEMADDYFEDDYALDGFLDNGDYTYVGIFQMTDEEKEKVKEKWRAQCKADAEENFAEEYDYEVIEMEV